MAAPNFWDDPSAAQPVIAQVKRLQEALGSVDAVNRELEDTTVLVDLAAEEQDLSVRGEIGEALTKLERQLHELETASLLNGENDAKNAILSIHPGAGGTESCDWAEMLLRMYLRWIEQRGYNHEIVDILAGDGAGIKSVTLTVEGPYAYGYLKAEEGVHRLVRISPFDANRRRHTSFAAVEVLAQVEEDIEVDIEDKDLRIDYYRASGHGGQHVNKTSSAVRITHLPTNIVVQCQSERSQHQNRAVAMKVLRARLLDRLVKQREEELAKERANQSDVAWGSQIRSYVLHPYQMIKDHRTGVETGNVKAVLDGGIDQFIEAYLRFSLNRAST
jgi:peptide chain release factor 2